MRIISLLPSATEILCGIGLADQIVGISHTCDYPREICDRPRVTRSSLSDSMSSAEIHRRVHERGASSLYSIDDERLKALSPDLILAQAQCSVCAVDERDILQCLESNHIQARTVSLSATQLADLPEDIRRIGEATGHESAAAAMIDRFDSRLERVRSSTRNRRRVRVSSLSWFDPLMAASHWIGDMVSIAGGEDRLGENAVQSRALNFQQIRAYAPQVLFLMPCAFSLERIEAEWRAIRQDVCWSNLPAVREGRVFALESDLYHRSGPRIADGVELMASLLHPEGFCNSEMSAARKVA